MNLKKFLTEYDEDLTGDSYIDPLGVQVVWSAFGHQIFSNKVNSISNDVRNYTLNLLNHAIIKSLIEDETVSLKPALIKLIGDKSSLSFRHACLIYLENLFTFSLSDPRKSQEIDTSGVIGSSKARQRWQDPSQGLMIYLYDKEKVSKQQVFLLVRQLGLGVSGRYKTPFSEIGFFKGRYEYDHPDCCDVWEKATALIQKSKPLKNVFDQTRSHLANIIKSHQGNQPPGCTYKELPSKLREAYQSAFPTPQVVGQETKEFWLDVTQLNEGAAGALLEELKRNLDKDWDYVDLFSKAEKNVAKQPAQKQKLTNIKTLEPLLGEFDLLFQIARQKKTQSINDIKTTWQALGRTDQTLPDLAAKVKSSSILLDVLVGKETAKRRLGQILASASHTNFKNQLLTLLDYHKTVMQVRGQQPWAESIDNTTIKVHARTTKTPERSERPINAWVNSYYIPQFHNLVRGFHGPAQ